MLISAKISLKYNSQAMQAVFDLLQFLEKVQWVMVT